MSAWPEASYTIGEVNKNASGGNTSALKITTTYEDWIGENFTVTNGVETVTGTLTAVSPSLVPKGYAVVEVKYIGSYDIIIGEFSERVVINNLGEVQDIALEPYHI